MVDPNICTACQGNGKCFRCGGSGSRSGSLPSPSATGAGIGGTSAPHKRSCPECLGSGTCQVCHGSGKIKNEA